MTRMSRSHWLLALGLLAIVGLNLVTFARRAPAGPANAASDIAPAPLVAAPGVIEPKSEAARVSAEVGGKMERVLVEERDTAAADRVMAELMNDDYEARVEE